MAMDLEPGPKGPLKGEKGVLSRCMTLEEFCANVTLPNLEIFVAEIHAEYLRLQASEGGGSP